MIKTPCSTFSKISFHNFDKSLSLVEKETVVSGSRGRRSRFFFNPSQMADSFRPINRQWKETVVRRGVGVTFRSTWKKEKEKKKKGRKPLITVIRVGRGATRINKIN